MNAGRALPLLCLAAAMLLLPAGASAGSLPPQASVPGGDAAQSLPLPRPTDVEPVAVDAAVGVEADGPVGLDGLDETVTVSASAEGDAVSVALPPDLPAVDEASGSAAGVLSPHSVGRRVAVYAPPVAGSALALAAGALAWRALGSLLPSIPLFSRIERDRLLDNPVRARVHDAVAQDPGLSMSEVASRAGIAWGTAVHHLRRLEANGMVVSTAERGHRRFFAANTPAASQRSAVAVVMHPTARRIAHLVAQRPGIDQTGICQALSLNNPAASKHLGRFEAQGLVLGLRSGRSRLYHPTGGLQSALLLIESPKAEPLIHVHARVATPQAIAC